MAKTKTKRPQRGRYARTWESRRRDLQELQRGTAVRYVPASELPPPVHTEHIGRVRPKTWVPVDEWLRATDRRRELSFPADGYGEMDCS